MVAKEELQLFAIIALGFIAKECGKPELIDEYLTVASLPGVSRNFNKRHQDEFLQEHYK